MPVKMWIPPRIKQKISIFIGSFKGLNHSARSMLKGSPVISVYTEEIASPKNPPNSAPHTKVDTPQITTRIIA